MRKLAYPEFNDKIKKLMIYESPDGVFLFGYDCLQDSSSIWDNWFLTLDEAEEYSLDAYNVSKEDWIEISEPRSDCQHDFILPTKPIKTQNGETKFGLFQTFVGRWLDYGNAEKCLSFGGLTGNERLFVSGLIYEFEKAKETDKSKAVKILKVLKFDEDSIRQIV